jgi:hypothetical protein
MGKSLGSFSSTPGGSRTHNPRLRRPSHQKIDTRAALIVNVNRRNAARLAAIEARFARRIDRLEAGLSVGPVTAMRLDAIVTAEVRK